MNCTELYQDIATLTAERDKLSADFARANETMEGITALKELSTKIDQLENQILEKYLANFAEKNPNISGWQITNQSIELKDESSDKNVKANDLTQLSNGNILVTSNGNIYEYQPDENGKWQTVGHMVAIDYRDNPMDMWAIAQLANDDVLVGGQDVFYEIVKNENGEWISRQQVRCPRGRYSYMIIPLSDESVLVGDYKELYEYERGKNNKWKPGKRFTGFRDAQSGDVVTVGAITRLSDGNMLVVDDEDQMRIYQQLADDKWQAVGSSIEFEEAVSVITQLSDGAVLIGTSDGMICEYEQDKHGEWKLKERVIKLKDDDGYDEIPRNITQLSNDNVIVGGSRGKLTELKKHSLLQTVDDLRQNLDKLGEI